MSFALFLSVVMFGWLFILYLEKVGKLPAERHAVLLLFKTERGKGFIEWISGYKRFWKLFGSMAILIGILGMVLVVFSLLFSIYSTYFLHEVSEGVMLVIPGVTIPFWEGIIALITVLVVHEFAHGILARREDVSIKSLGAILVTIIPIGAFVEPDEEELKAKEIGPRMRVYAAGSFANILLAILILIAMGSFSGYFIDSSVIQIAGTVKCSPADGPLRGGMLVEAINGKPVSGIRDFFEITRDLKPNTDVKINTDEGLFIIKTTNHPDYPDRGYIGISPISPLYPGLPEFIFTVLKWIFQLNLGIGLINLAPLHLGIAATDGYYIFRDILSKFRVKNVEKVVTAVSSGVLILLVMSLLWPVRVPVPAVVC